jgi:signal transduction histidine kinase
MGALGVLIAVLQTVGTMLPAYDRLDALAYALLILSGLAIGVSRRVPSVALAIAAAATVVYAIRGYPGAPTLLALAAALLVAAVKDRWPFILGIGILSYIVWFAALDPPAGRAIAVGVASFFAVILSGVVVGIAGEIRKLLREQKRLQEERRRRQASEERLRIAQELHDVLGHHLSLINMRARVGLHLMDRQPEQARAALDTINMASAEALREVRSVLDTLYPADEAPPKTPTPGLSDLASLTGDAGLPVTTAVEGTARELPAEIDRAAYRIVQEALTNVRRHAGPGATATVTIGYREDAVSIEVEDDGGTAAPIATPRSEGTGVSGMRERATTLGGSLTAGPRPGGGWRVAANLPAPVEIGSDVPGGTG